MANTVIQVRKSATSGNVPVSLANGELAINYADGKLYYKNTQGQTGYIYSSNSFATFNVSSSLILASSNTDTISLVGANGISATACTVTKTITLDGVVAFNQANAAYSQANAAYAAANNVAPQIQPAFNQANSAFNTANSASSNTIVTQGVDATQNTNIALAQSFANGAFVTANLAASFANGAFTVANSASSNTIVTQGVDVTQNTNIASAQLFANGAFSTANLAYNTANTGYNFVTTGGTVGGSVTINGNFTVNGTQTIVNSSTVSYNNPYIALHEANTGYLTTNDGVDIGVDFEYYSPQSIAPRLVTGGSANGTYATLSISDNTYYAPNTSVLIQGVTPSNFNGSFVVTGASPGSITYALSYTGTVTSTNGVSLGTAQKYTQATITGGSTVNGSKVSTITISPSLTIPVGATVTITGCTPSGYNGTWTVTASSAGSFSFVNTSNQSNITVNGIVTFDNRRAFIGRANDSQAFEFYKTGTFYNGAFEGIYGTLKASRFFASPSQGSPGADILNGFLGTTTETIFDTTSATNLVNGQTATANLAILTIGAANTNVHYNGAATLRIMGAPVAGNNVVFDSNSYSIQVDSGDSYFNGKIIFNSQGAIKFNDNTLQTTNSAPYAYSVASFNQANSAYASQNITAGFANAAFAAANNVTPQVQPAFNQANSAYAAVNALNIIANTLTTSTTTANQVAMLFSTTAYRAGKVILQITSGSSYQYSEIALLHNGTNTYMTQFGDIYTAGSNLGTFDSNISGGYLQLLFTPVNAATTLKTTTTLIPV
jgi:hypothetical protein